MTDPQHYTSYFTDENDEGPLPPPTMTSSQKISDLAEKAIEWRKKVGEGPWPGEFFWPTDIEFITAASPSEWLALRNGVLEEAAKAVIGAPVFGKKGSAHQDAKNIHTIDVCVKAIRALKHQRPA